MSAKTVSMLILVLPIAVIMSCIRDKTAWKGTIEEKDGVVIVRNPREPMFDESALSLEEELTVGDRETNGDYIFEVITTIRADDSGNIYVLDGKAQQVKVFDKKGHFLRDIGRRGQGPGEYSMPSGIHILSKNEIMVSSVSRRLSFFSLNGEFLRQIEKSPDPFPVPDSRGDFIVKIMTMGVGENTVTELKKLNSGFDLLFSIGTLEVKSPFGQKRADPFPAQLYFAVLDDDSIVWGINNDYLLTIVDPNGNIEKKIINDTAPVRVTDEYKKNYLGRGEDELSRALGISYEFPEYFPPFRNISSDDRGRIFVGTFKRDERHIEYYDVFDREGRYLAKIGVKNRAVYWKQGKLYCIEEDAEGYQIVKRYNIVWNY